MSKATNAEPLPSRDNEATILAEVVTIGTQHADTRLGWLPEEQSVGSYQQPEWTAERRFLSTRVYLQQMPWNVGVEQWVRGQCFHNGEAETRFQEEVEIGLPHRF